MDNTEKFGLIIVISSLIIAFYFTAFKMYSINTKSNSDAVTVDIRGLDESDNTFELGMSKGYVDCYIFYTADSEGKINVAEAPCDNSCVVTLDSNKDKPYAVITKSKSGGVYGAELHLPSNYKTTVITESKNSASNCITAYPIYIP